MIKFFQKRREQRLRDDIARHALAGLLATGQDFHDDSGDGWEWHARAAYAMADAMLVARKR